MKRILFALAIISGLASCNYAGRRVNGSGNIITKDRTINAFRHLSVRGSMEVYLKQDVASAKIEADDNIVPLVELNLNGDELVVKYKNGVDINTQSPVKVYLSSPTVNKIGLMGSGDVHGENELSNDEQLSLSVAGSGNMDIQTHTPVVNATIAGSGNLKINGQTRDLKIKIAGSGDLKAMDLMAENVDANIIGSGNANVYASGKLNAKIVGSGDLYYKGDPSMNNHIMGSGQVLKK